MRKVWKGKRSFAIHAQNNGAGSQESRRSERNIRPVLTNPRFDWIGSFHDDNPGLANVIKLTIAFDVVTDRGIIGHRDIFVQDGPADSGSASNLTVVKNNGFLYQSAALNVHTTAQY